MRGADVCVCQCTELLNLAMLTGRMQRHAMRIYAVSHSGRLSDVTSQTTCHSGDQQALKVWAASVRLSGSVHCTEELN